MWRWYKINQHSIVLNCHWIVSDCHGIYYCESSIESKCDVKYAKTVKSHEHTFSSCDYGEINNFVGTYFQK